MITMLKLLTILFGFCFVLTFAHQDLIDYWVGHGEAEDQEYRQLGRICERRCHFPFYHEDQLIYGCIPSNGLVGYTCPGCFEHTVCKDSNGQFILCPYSCPNGEAKLLKLQPSRSPTDNSVILECSGYGSPNPTITVRKNGEVAEVVKPPDNEYPTVVKTTISLKYEEKDYGVYSCELDNGHSSDSSVKDRRLWEKVRFKGNYNFTGIEPPLTPTNLRVVSIYRTYVTLEWEFEELYQGDPCQYELLVVPGKTPESRSFRKRFIDKKKFEVRYLLPSVEYEFKVRRISRFGYGLYSEPVYAAIPADAPIDGPVNLTVTDLGTENVSLAWNIAGDHERSMPTWLHYSTECGSGEFNETVSFFGKNFTAIGLLPATKYKFEVETLLERNIKPRSEPFYVTTAPIAPSIQNLQTKDDDHNEVLIICKVSGGPLPEISWKNNDEPLPPTVLVNTTFLCKSVISFITLSRTPFVYSDYSCLANNSQGVDTKTITLAYNGAHPPVGLGRMMMKMAKDIEEMKEEQKSNRDLLWRILLRG